MEHPPAETRTFGRSRGRGRAGRYHSGGGRCHRQTRRTTPSLMAAASTARFARQQAPELSGEMRSRYPAGTPTGTAVATGAYALPARWVIHPVGPVWGFGGQDKLDLLASAYRTALHVADDLGARTICSPAISAGTFGFPGRDRSRCRPADGPRLPPAGHRHRTSDIRPPAGRLRDLQAPPGRHLTRRPTRRVASSNRVISGAPTCDTPSHRPGTWPSLLEL